MLEIELDEAKRRTEGMLVRQGYRTCGRWTDAVYAKEEGEPIVSMALIGLENTRVLLYPERDHWRSVISVKVGRGGEFPVCSGFIERTRSKYMPPFTKMEKKIVDTRDQVRRWGFQSANVYSAQALARLAEVYIKKKHYRKARIALSAIIFGTINAATVSEALSMVQTMVARSREDRLDSALIWSEVYK